MTESAFELLGCDFTSAPSRRKPITLAVGRIDRGRVVLQTLEVFEDLNGWQKRLQQTDAVPWVGGFDLPFGLPRELVTSLGWPTDWLPCIRQYGALSRETIRARFAAFCDSRPVGGKFAHRATDGPAGSSPSMKWVNPPVAFMLHAGVPLLLEAGVSLPGLHEGDPDRIALEAYPGLLARSVLGKLSYKADDKARQTSERLIARKTLIEALETGRAPLLQAASLRLKLSHAQRDDLADDPSGDRLDAVLCLVQAAWALQQHLSGHPRWGLPDFDPLEGWIVTA
ncbi:DUF429 domain-containing protein [Hydrogenophaga sp. PAMC20947]|uniref:DUF429 domain-containing protein n=1 Tax=Hydrogenophaga sp. PAMC20947 TaxID=2565558 RepID=UPI00109E0125|nr:DUF429 domain-containing protein [Hydrogenophaga sp. PAMC20947]QCB46654.1 DUF429 domain-containing protein [Hydrogenophaga sp. PAMC20947]